MDEQIKKIELYPKPFSANGIMRRVYWDSNKKEWVEQTAIGRFPTDQDPEHSFKLSDRAYDTVLAMFHLQKYCYQLPKARLSKMSPDELQNYQGPDEKIKASASPRLTLVKADPDLQKLERSLLCLIEHE